jgi:hypothetical protein
MSDSKEETSDVFIAHASEDKDSVARPLAKALAAQGWSVWLDELNLTVGDSLSQRIDSALAQTRFGVVLLSPAFFSKEWPQRELAGLAARELDTGAKVILPVWHNVDRSFIVQHSPVLADRLGAPTSAGIENVAKEISLALKGTEGDPAAEATEEGVEEVTEANGVPLFQIPTTEGEQARIIEECPEWWEYRLYAGVLVAGRIELEDKWLDHELRLPSGPRRNVDSEAVTDFLSRELNWVSRQVSAIDRVFDPETLERAFGAKGKSGDPAVIKSVARGVIRIYDSFLDWAATLRNTSVSEDYAEVLELIARMVDGPARQIRDFTQHVGDQIARLPSLLKEAEKSGATVESPMTLTLTLSLSIDKQVQNELDSAFDRLRQVKGHLGVRVRLSRDTPAREVAR